MKTQIIKTIVFLILVLILHSQTSFITPSAQTKSISQSIYLPIIQNPENIWLSASNGMGNANFTFAISPAYSIDKTIFAGTYNFTGDGTGGAIYKSLDGGLSWQLSDTGLSGEAITTLAISPNYSMDRTLFLGVLAGLGAQLYKSVDGGTSWLPSGNFSQNANDIAISPNYAIDLTVFATVDDGVYKTTDGGATWAGVYTHPNFFGWATKLSISPTYSTDRTIFVQSENSELSKSTDSGNTWTVLPLFPGVIKSVTISPNYLDDHTLYTFVNLDNYTNRIFKSIDGGVSWTELQASFDYLHFVKGSIELSPNIAKDHTLYFIGTVYNSPNYSISLYISNDDGATWVLIPSLGTHCTQGNIHLSSSYATDQRIFAGCIEGFYESIDRGENWTRLSAGVAMAIVHEFVFSPNYAIDGTAFAATTCNGIYKSIDQATTWFSVSEGLNYSNNSCILSLAISPDYLADHTIFAGGSYEGIYKSTNEGMTWTRVDNFGFSPESLVRSISISPNYKSDHTIFAGTLGGIVRSNDSGTTWEKLETGSFSLNNTYDIVISPNYSSDKRIFAGTDFIGDGLAKSSDGGNTWNLVTQTIVIFDLLWIPGQDIEDFSIFFGSCNGQICRTDDFGISWSCNQSLGESILSMAHLSNDNSVFVGTGDAGVYWSADNGVSWQSLNKGLGSMRVYTLAIAPTNPPTLFAGTPAGVWQIKLP